MDNNVVEAEYDVYRYEDDVHPQGSLVWVRREFIMHRISEIPSDADIMAKIEREKDHYPAARYRVLPRFASLDFTTEHEVTWP